MSTSPFTPHMKPLDLADAVVLDKVMDDRLNDVYLVLEGSEEPEWLKPLEATGSARGA